MGSISIIHWLIVLIVLGAWIFPIAIIVGKAGFSRWWALLALAPLINFIALWAFALVRWPAEKKSDA